MRAKNELQQLSEAYQRVLSEAQFEGAYVSGTEEVEPQPDLNTLEGSIQAKKNPSVKYGWRVSTGETIPSLEPNEQGQHTQEAPEGNIIITGHIKTGNTPDGEQWSQKPEKFEKDYTKVSDTEATAVGVNPVAMRQMAEPFKVHTSWGSVLEGKPGDLLTQYGVGDYGVLDQDAFSAYYTEGEEGIEGLPQAARHPLADKLPDITGGRFAVGLT